MDFSDDLINLFESEDGGMFEPPKKAARLTADDRLVASFQSIVDFVEANDRLPELESSDIGEASLAARLNSIRIDKAKADALRPIDSLGLLALPKAPESVDELFEEDDSGLFDGVGDDILKMKHVPYRRLVVNRADEVAKRIPASDFADFKHMFENVQQELKIGTKKLTPFTSISQLKLHGFYINHGQMVYVAEWGKVDKKVGYTQQRLRVIIENGTESNLYRRSLAQKLYDGGSVVVDKDYAGEAQLSLDDKISGYLYVLKSKSADEKITTIKDLHKIGFSTTTVAERIKDAEKDPTYLMAPVEVVDSYIITGDYNPQKVEYFIHRIFADVKVDLTIVDARGKEYVPSEWYSVPLLAIEQAVNMLQNGDIIDYHYDKNMRQIMPNNMAS